jgi:hypothetical protein
VKLFTAQLPPSSFYFLFGANILLNICSLTYPISVLPLGQEAECNTLHCRTLFVVITRILQALAKAFLILTYQKSIRL